MSKITYSNNSMHLIFLTFILVVSYSNGASPINGSRLHGMFIFGSSIVDNGNNNELFGDIAKANFKPYGVDFANGPTGRFSNGKNVADLVADQLGLPYVPPFSDPKTKNVVIVNGVNFASGGSGILDVTGIVLGVTSMNNQIRNFKDNILPELERELGSKSHRILPQYLFLVGAGDNDYISYYLLQQKRIWTPMEFAAKLISDLSAQIKALYDVGARKFLILSVYPVGCNPEFAKDKETCVEELNAAVVLFYGQLKLMIKHKDQQQMPDAHFTLVNSQKIITNLIRNPNGTGFTNVDFACCETNMGGMCKKETTNICPKRDRYVYFDGMHLTEAASSVLATTAYKSFNTLEVFPFNLKKLSQI